MSGHTVVNLKEVEDKAPQFGFAPHLESRFARVPLELQNSGLSHFKIAPDFRIPFGHSHSEQEETLRRLQPKIQLLKQLLEPIARLPYVTDVRQRGFMVGIELEGFPVDARMGHRVAMEARERGAVIRPLGDVVVLMPPLAIEATTSAAAAPPLAA